MNINIVPSFILSLFLLSGCVQHTQNTPEPNTEIVLLSQKVQKLNAEDKLLIYRSIQDEINLYNENGDEAYERGYNYDAFTAYELVNFYEGYSTVPLSKINRIKKSAKDNSQKYYKQALLYTKTDKKKAVVAFNRVMMNDPKYKDAPEKLEELKSSRDMKIFINSMENSLQMKLLNNRGDVKDLQDINSQSDKLLKYDYKNETAFKAKETLKEYHDILIKNAIDTFNKGDLKKSKRKFISILSIYKKDQTSINYLNKIKTINKKSLNIKLAQQALNSKEYIRSINYAQKVLKVNPKNKQAKKIMLTAKKSSKKEVANLIRLGKDYYNRKNLDKARESFNAVLNIDPYNNTSLIYSKKIERQLKTINSLQ